MDTVNFLLVLPILGLAGWIGFRVLRFAGVALIVALSGVADSDG